MLLAIGTMLMIFTTPQSSAYSYILRGPAIYLASLRAEGDARDRAHSQRDVLSCRSDPEHNAAVVMPLVVGLVILALTPGFRSRL